MKNTLFVFFTLVAGWQGFAQVQSPKASPACKIEQKVGLSDLKIEYYRPSAKGRSVFGDVVPFDQLWRFGANENTKLSCSDALIFGKDTLPAGTYAIYAKPSKNTWEIYFYTETTNWGLPEQFDAKKVALTLYIPTQKTASFVETFSLNFDALTNNSAQLVMTWENTQLAIPFTLNTKDKVLASIQKTMAGPSANDYHAAANYYFTENLDLKQALEWSTKAVEMRGPSAYWMTRLNAQLKAANGDYKGAIETAKLSMEEARKDNDENYVHMNEKSIAEWSKK
ncbi:MAG: hypothetical protein RLZZ301_1616 [Bacteroidota bacterium]|jgi:hypothetical protein